MDSNTTTVKIPKVFFDDHQNRGLVSAESRIVKTLSKHLIVELTVSDLDELISDCEHYTTRGQYEWEFQYLVSSARATLAAIRKQTNN